MCARQHPSQTQEEDRPGRTDASCALLRLHDAAPGPVYADVLLHDAVRQRPAPADGPRKCHSIVSSLEALAAVSMTSVPCRWRSDETGVWALGYTHPQRQRAP